MLCYVLGRIYYNNRIRLAPRWHDPYILNIIEENMTNIKIIDTDFGKMMINKNDLYVGQLLDNYGEYCPAEVAIFKNCISSESIVVDVGANIGASTLPFAAMAKHVYAFEPHPELFNMLCGNLALNEIKNVTPYKLGCGEKVKILGYQDLNFDEIGNYGGHTLQEDFDEEHQVSIVQLNIPCNFLKIDVEGMELQVLRGAINMIEECRPVMFVENDREEKSDELLKYINETLDYIAYWHNFSFYRPDNFNKNPINYYGEVGGINLICFPREIPADLTEFGFRLAIPGSSWK